MDDSRNIFKNFAGVSEVLSQVLMICIMITGITMVALFVFSQDNPDYGPHVDVQQRVDGASDVLYLKHSGGEALSAGNLMLIVSVDGDKNVLSDAEIYESLGKSCWEAGDVIAIDMYEKWGVRLESEDCVDVFLVDQKSKRLIQKAELPMAGMCKPLLKLGMWHFFTTVEGNDSAGLNLTDLQDCGLDVEFSPAALGDNSEDIALEKDNTDYFANNSFHHNLKDDPLDLTFGFEEAGYKGLEPPLYNATILMIYCLQSDPGEAELEIAGEEMPTFVNDNSGTKNWYIYNKTVSVNITSISELKFNFHFEGVGEKTIDIDYLAVYLS